MGTTSKIISPNLSPSTSMATDRGIIKAGRGLQGHQLQPSTQQLMPTRAGVTAADGAGLMAQVNDLRGLLPAQQLCGAMITSGVSQPPGLDLAACRSSQCRQPCPQSCAEQSWELPARRSCSALPIMPPPTTGRNHSPTATQTPACPEAGH